MADAERKRLPLLCPSVGTPSRFYTEPCERVACRWWKDGCSAQNTVLKEYTAFLDVEPMAPSCPKAAACTWHQEGPCAPRRLGMLCEHVTDPRTGEEGEWNTFGMAPASEWEAACA